MESVTCSTTTELSTADVIPSTDFCLDMMGSGRAGDSAGGREGLEWLLLRRRVGKRNHMGFNTHVNKCNKIECVSTSLLHELPVCFPFYACSSRLNKLLENNSDKKSKSMN